jgi:uncharacterized protein YbaR (Trm112 family)
MHIELVDALRCPFPHEETWLVASVTRFDGRDISEGALGCPICQRQFPVREGAVDFAPGSAGERDERDERDTPAADAVVGVDEQALLRARALLALDDGGGTVLVGGALAPLAEALADAVPVMPLLLNPAAGAGSGGRPPSAMRAAGGVPLAAGVLRAAWLDAATATPPLLAGVVRALRPGGRLVAPAHAPVPAGIRELARDAREWVGERDATVPAASAPVTLRRR